MKKTIPFLVFFAFLVMGALAACASAGQPQDGPQIVVYRAPT